MRSSAMRRCDDVGELDAVRGRQRLRGSRRACGRTTSASSPRPRRGRAGRRPGAGTGRRSRRRRRPRRGRATAASPAARPCSGPRSSLASWTSSTSSGSAGSSCPGARTTTTGPSTARPTMPVMRRSSVDPCHSSAAFGVPMREDRPPARTMPAVSATAHRHREDHELRIGRQIAGPARCGPRRRPSRRSRHRPRVASPPPRRARRRCRRRTTRRRSRRPPASCAEASPCAPRYLHSAARQGRPIGLSDTTVEPAAAVAAWLGSFERGARRRRRGGAPPSCSARTASGATSSRSPGTSRRSRAATRSGPCSRRSCRTSRPSGWRTTEPPTAADGTTEAWIAFETAVGRGTGHLRLRDGRAWTLLTTLAELKGHEEPSGERRRTGRRPRRASATG